MKHLHNQRFWQTALGVMLVPLAFVAFWPSPVDQPVQGLLADILSFLHGHGIPQWFNYTFIEAAANVVLFVPLGLVAMLAYPEKQWWQVSSFGLLISACMELGQLLFLHNRFASFVDLMTTTSGTVIGVLLAFVAAEELKARDLRAAGPQTGSQTT